MRYPTKSAIYWYKEPVDMRKSIDGLSIIVLEALSQQATSGDIYVFGNRQRDKIKILYWDGSGFCLWYKRLERAKFIYPVMIQGSIELSQQELNWLLDGLDISTLRGHEILKTEVAF